MSGTTETRAAWECGSCRVVARKPEVGAIPMPTGWERDEEGRPKCLACVRRDDPKAARAASKVDLARERRKEQAAEEREIKVSECRALLLARDDPWGTAAIEEAATAAGCGLKLAGAARRELAAEGLIAPRATSRRAARPAPTRPRRQRRPPGPKADPAVEAALQADPDRLDREIAAELDVYAQKVSEARKRLGLPNSTERRIAAARREVTAALAEMGSAGAAEVAAAAGLNFQTARTRLEELVASGAAVKREVARPRKNAPRTLYRPRPTRAPA